MEISRVFLLLCHPENEEFLAILRADDRTWGLPGGKVEGDETPEQAIRRESYQEIGFRPKEPHESYTFQPVTSVGCIVYVDRLKRPYTPTLNAESLSFKWSNLDDWPRPSHPQMARVINENKDGFLDHVRRLPLPN